MCPRKAASTVYPHPATAAATVAASDEALRMAGSARMGRHDASVAEY